MQINNGFNFSDFSGLTAAQKLQDEIELNASNDLVIYRFEKPAGCRVVFTCDIYVVSSADPSTEVRAVIRQRAPGNLGVGTTYPGFTDKIGEWVTVTTSADFTDPILMSNPDDANGHCRLEITGDAVARFRRPRVTIEPLPHMGGMNPFFYSLGGTNEGFSRLGGMMGFAWKRVDVDFTETENRFDLPDGADRLLGNELVCGWSLSSAQQDVGSVIGGLPSRVACRARSSTYDETAPGATQNTVSIFSSGDGTATSVLVDVWVMGRCKIVDQDWDV